MRCVSQKVFSASSESRFNLHLRCHHIAGMASLVPVKPDRMGTCFFPFLALFPAVGPLPLQRPITDAQQSLGVSRGPVWFASFEVTGTAEGQRGSSMWRARTDLGESESNVWKMSENNMNFDGNRWEEMKALRAALRHSSPSCLFLKEMCSLRHRWRRCCRFDFHTAAPPHSSAKRTC